MYNMSFIELLMPQRFYGVQTGCFQGRKVTKDYANCSRKEERKDHNTSIEDEGDSQYSGQP